MPISAGVRKNFGYKKLNHQSYLIDSIESSSVIMPLPLDRPFILKDVFNIAAHQNDLPWKPFRDGIDAYWIYQEPTGGPSAALLRFQAGAKVAWHEHVGFEHILVLSGSQSDENGRLQTGSLMVNQPGSGHSITSEEGCIVLAIYQKPVSFARIQAES